MTTERQISNESADDQIQSFLDHYDIDLDDITNERSRDALEQTLRKIKRAIKKGRVEFLEGGLVNMHYTGPDGQPKTFNFVEVRGSHKLVLDQKKEDKNYSKIYAILGSISNTGERPFQTLSGKDIGLAECLGSLFLQV